MVRAHSRVARLVLFHLFLPAVGQQIQLPLLLNRGINRVDCPKWGFDGAVLVEHVLRSLTDAVVVAQEIGREDLLAEKFLRFLRQLANNHIDVLHVDLAVVRDAGNQMVEDCDFALSSLRNDLNRGIYVCVSHGETSHPPDHGAI